MPKSETSRLLNFPFKKIFQMKNFSIIFKSTLLAFFIFSNLNNAFSQWAIVKNGSLPKGAFVAAKSTDGKSIFIARTNLKGETQIGTFISGSKSAIFAANNNVYQLTDFEIFAGTGNWSAVQKGNVPQNAIESGMTAIDGSQILIARANIKGQGWTIGSFRAPVAYFPVGQIVQSLTTGFEILVAAETETPTSTCAVAFSEANYQGQPFEMCNRGARNVPFEVKSVKVPNGYEVSYSPAGGECFDDQANTIISRDKPNLADNPVCTNQPFYVVSAPDAFNQLKITIITGSDDLRDGNLFFFTLHMRNGFSFPEAAFPLQLPGGLASNSTRTFLYSVFATNQQLNLNYKDIAAITIRHDGNPRPGQHFDEYDKWDLKKIYLDWDGRVPKSVVFTPTQFNSQMRSKRFSTN